MTIIVYYTSCPFNKTTVSQQSRIDQILKAKGVDFEMVDIASDKTLLGEMREIVGDPEAVAPQICNGNEYCGNYEMLDDANESGELFSFLKLPPKSQEQS